MCNDTPVMPDVNLNRNFPLGPYNRDPLKPYNHVDCVQEVSVWSDRATTLNRLHSYHTQAHRVARANKNMPSSRKQTPPLSSHPKVQKHLNKLADMAYHRSKAADRVPLARESRKTNIGDCKRYLRDLSTGNRADQKVYSVLKDRVKDDALELFGLRNLPVEHDPKDYFPSKVDLHLQQQFSKNNELKL